MATVIVVVIGIIWIPIMANISGVLYEYLQSVQAYIAPPITAVFLMGIFHKRVNANGAFATLVMGIVIAFFRITLELIKGNFDPNSFLYKLGDMNFLSFGAWFFLFCILFIIVVSLLSPAPSREKVVNLTFGTITAEEKLKNKNSYNWVDISISILIIIIVIGVMVFFNGN